MARISFKRVIGLLPSLFVGIAVLELLDVQTKYLFSLILTILTYLLYEYLVTEDKSWTINAPNWDFIFSIIYSISIAIVTLISPSYIILYSSWSEIPYHYLAQSLFSILLTTFLPGYAILRVIDKARSIRGVSAIIFSMVLSILSNAFIGFALTIMKSSLSQIGIPVLLGFNCFLLSIFLVKFYSEGNLKPSQDAYVLFPRESLILLSLIALQIAFSYSICSINFPLAPYDEWKRHGYAMSHYMGSFPIEAPWLLHLYLASVYTISVIPTVNMQQMLLFIDVMPIIALYVTLSAFFKQKHPKIPVIGTFFGFFGGFGWIYALYLRLLGSSSLYDIFVISSEKTMNNSRAFPVFYLAPYTTPAQVVGVVSFLLLMYLVFIHHLNGITSCILTVLVSIYDHLGHLYDTPLYILFLMLLVIISFFKRDDHAQRRRFLRTSLCILSSSLITIFINLLTPSEVFHPLSSVASYALTASILISITTIMLCIFRKKDSVRIGTKSERSRSFLKVITIVSSIYVYGISFIIWSHIIPYFHASKTRFFTAGVLGSGVTILVPWYLYPMMLGVLGFVGLICIVFLTFRSSIKEEELHTFILLAFFAFVCERSLHLFYPIMPFLGTRFLTLWWIALCPLAAYPIIKLFNFKHSISKNLTKTAISVKFYKRTFLSAFILSLIIISGISYSLLYVEFLTYGYAAPGYQLSKSELDALNYLRLRSQANYSVLTVTHKSALALLGFGGIRYNTQILYSLSHADAFFAPHRPETVIYALNDSSVKYIYLSPRDVEAIKSNPTYVNGYFFTHLLPHLPIAFNNSEAVIYEVPFVSPQSVAVPLPTEYVKYLELTGQVEVTSNFVLLSAVNLEVERINFLSKYGPTSISSFTLNSLKVQEPMNACIVAHKVSIESDGFGRYVVLNVHGNFTLNLVNFSSAMLTTIIKSRISILQASEFLELSALARENTKIIVKSPRIFVQGQMSIVNPVLYVKPYLLTVLAEAPAYVPPITIEGNSTLNIMYSDGIIVISPKHGFSFDGKMSVEYPGNWQKPYWNEWSIPWLKVLFSPYHFLLLLLLPFIIIIISEHLGFYRIKIKVRIKR